MANHTVEGYLALLVMRGSRSVLVEGPTDQHSLWLLLRKFEASGRQIIPGLSVDYMEMIQDNVLPPSKREGVEFIHAKCQAEGIELLALVDREFRDFTLRPAIQDSSPFHKHRAGLYWTRGHSIENYLLTSNYILSYVSMRFPIDTSHSRCTAVDEAMGDILIQSAALSLSLSEASLLNRAQGLITASLWKHTPQGELHFDIDELGLHLRGRAVDHATCQHVVRGFRSYMSQVALHDPQRIARWICHGHIGWDCIWSAVARTLELHGCAPDLVMEVSHGHKDEKWRHVIGHWTSDAVLGNCVFPLELVSELLVAA